MTREALAGAAQAEFASTFPGLEAQETHPISERTIRFWTREGLLPPRGGPNRAAHYEPELVQRCVFIRRLKLEESLGLDDIRQVLDQVDDKTIQRVATGQEPLRIAAADPEGRSTEHARPGESLVLLPRKRPLRDRPLPQSDDRPVGLSDLSDLDKAQAISDGLYEVTGHRFNVEINSVDYAVIGHRGSFRSPARIQCMISSPAGAAEDEDPGAALQRVSDTALSSAIAQSLSDRTSSRVAAEVLTKQYATQRSVPRKETAHLLRLSVLIASPERAQ